ncbi:MAG: hypothetical protein ABIA04_03170 [Pseudomonadota bacterium]
MSRQSLSVYIKQLKRPVFTTFELASLSGKSLSTTSQSLSYLQKEGLIKKVYRGIWIDADSEKVNPYMIIPFLFPRQRVYVSFLSALHMHGIIEQIPQMITVAATCQPKILKTAIGVFSIHQIAASFFNGFDWYKETGNFLLAEPEKALIDCLYLSTRKKKQFAHFPELYFPKAFSAKKVEKWINTISEKRIRASVFGKWETLGFGRKFIG